MARSRFLATPRLLAAVLGAAVLHGAGGVAAVAMARPLLAGSGGAEPPSAVLAAAPGPAGVVAAAQGAA
uniref:Uncharacterized protein n=1 Tax=Oryza barthii TaxID=65489 RepID=A0A0D3HFG5_9ORYZ